MRQQILQEHLNEALRLLDRVLGPLSECYYHPGDVQLHTEIYDFLNLDHQQPIPEFYTPRKG